MMIESGKFVKANASPGNSITCRWCSHEDLQEDYSLVWKDARFASYTVQRCPQCGIAFADPFPNPDDLLMLYNSVEYHENDRAAGNFWEMTPEQVARSVSFEDGFVKRYAQYLPTTGTMFDIGAGWGTLMKHFSDRAWQASGMEISATEAEFAQRVLELKVHQASIEQLDRLPIEPSDLVIMRHVLEHFYDPIATIKSVRQKLKENGLLIIEVPDYGSWDRKAYGDDWPALAPYHLWYFSEVSLRKLMESCGFRILSFNTFLSDRILSKPTIPHRFLRRVANRLGAKKIFSGRSIGLIAMPN